MPELTNDKQSNSDVMEKEKPTWVKRVIAYLIALLILPLIYFIAASKGALPDWVKVNQLIVECVLFGLTGGVTYCLRAVYLNKCVRKQWDTNWVTWYFLRPLVSLILGGITFFVLQIGLVTVGVKEAANPQHLFYVIAFFAGLNVDGFLKKFEGQISKSVGVSKSRQSS
ncbi:hypothetical protein GNP84_07185 [Aliivibrio fischeri]|uniref:hypothetical protein n=1 Tax=Aliivibrio fischeri TaxID=668 RepID=UPI0012D9D2E1|nr:hypothetical protein [Aliivibrio fischeri]MUK76689.1 hypothetical protein [Aliivibrio fischeri]